jgi:hypothetical protein
MQEVVDVVCPSLVTGVECSTSKTGGGEEQQESSFRQTWLDGRGHHHGTTAALALLENNNSIAHHHAPLKIIDIGRKPQACQDEHRKMLATIRPSNSIQVPSENVPKSPMSLCPFQIIPVHRGQLAGGLCQISQVVATSWGVVWEKCDMRITRSRRTSEPASEPLLE